MGSSPPFSQKPAHPLTNRGILSHGSLLNSYSGLEVDVLTDRDVEIYDALQDSGSALSLYLAGAVALDIASKRSLSDTERLGWITNASDSWRQILDTSTITGGVSHFTVDSSIRLSALPSYTSILLNNELPTEKIRTKYYKDLCLIGGLACKKWQESVQAREQHFDTKLSRDNRIRLAGTIGELAVLMLYQRFIKQELGDKEQLALTSRLTEDRGIGRNGGSYEVTAWDISVFQQFNEENIEMPYKIQVKTSDKNKAQRSFRYSDDVSVVVIKKDLALTPDEQENGFSPSQIICDILAEQENSNTSATNRRLEERTEKLLDKVDG